MSSQPLSTLSDFLSAQNILKMPIYQRQFSWEGRQLEDLWNDLFYLETGKRYYFGTILLKRTGVEERTGLRTYEAFEIIDGQQRIASILILLRCILDELNLVAESDQEKAEISAMENTYIRNAGLSKLMLLGKDDDVFKALISGGEVANIMTASQRRLVTARTLFKEKLREQKIAHESGFKTFLLDLMKKALRMEIMKHIVETPEEAVLIFETVNDRGIDLGSLDKTKSFLMHFLYLSGAAENNQNLKKVNDVFASIFSDLERMENRKRALSHSVKDFERDVQRMHNIIFKAGSTYFADAFASLKEDLIGRYRSDSGNKSESTFFAMEYVSSLGSAYSAVREILTYDGKDDLRPMLDRVFALGYGSTFPLLTCAWMKLGPNSQEIIKLMRAIESFLLRYNSFRSRRSYTTVDRINSRSYELYHGKVTFDSVLSSLEYLIKHYAPDGAFRADLESENFYYGTKSTIKLLFYEYERYLREKESETMDMPLVEWMSDKFQIDHIWAQAALSTGRDYQEYERCGHKLGNLTVLPSLANMGLSNANFSVKKIEYRKIALKNLKEIASADQWREKQIEERTSRVADFAMERWHIP